MATSNSKPEPRTAFAWPIYADATLAGMSVLIPIPGVDWFFESYFRGRMVGDIARYRGRTLPRPVAGILNQGGEGCVNSCLALPFQTTLWLLKRLSRKILYFLTVKEATDQLSYYWRRAFLIDYMLLAGHLENEASAHRARQAGRDALEQLDADPLISLARAVIGSTHRVFRSLRRARQGEEDEQIQEQKNFLAQHWSEVEGHLQALAERYYQNYRQMEGGAAGSEALVDGEL